MPLSLTRTVFDPLVQVAFRVGILFRVRCHHDLSVLRNLDASRRNARRDDRLNRPRHIGLFENQGPSHERLQMLLKSHFGAKITETFSNPEAEFREILSPTGQMPR